MKKILRAFLSLTVASAAILPTAEAAAQSSSTAPEQSDQKNWFVANNVFNHLDAALTVGTTGVGLELATPVTPWVRLRAGYDLMPHFSINSKFNVSNYGGTENDGKPNTSDASFNRATDLMETLTGYTVDRRITMNNKVTFQNWKVLLDIFPIPQNNHWRLTVGLYGGSKVLGKTINARSEYPSLVAIGMFNHLYDRITAPDFMDKIYDEPILGTPSNPIYLDPEVAMELQKKMERAGRFGIHVGNFRNGTPYMMEPDENGSVSAKAIINRVRPYLGIGYEGFMDAAKHWSAGFDLGVMFWGGAPKVYTHDGTCLNDLVNVRGDVKEYLDAMKGLPVWPTLNFRLSYTIF